MTFLDNLQSHKGGLIQLKTELYWYDGRGYDNTPGRICLILDAGEEAETFRATTVAAASPTRAAAVFAVALLFIEGQPQWVWVAEQDVDLL